MYMYALKSKLSGRYFARIGDCNSNVYIDCVDPDLSPYNIPSFFSVDDLFYVNPEWFTYERDMNKWPQIQGHSPKDVLVVEINLHVVKTIDEN